MKIVPYDFNSLRLIIIYFTKDLQCINMLNDMVNKEKELNSLKAEVSRLKNKILSIENATENEISSDDLLGKFDCLTSQLKLSRDEFNQLLEEHADCPTPAVDKS